MKRTSCFISCFVGLVTGLLAQGERQEVAGKVIDIQTKEPIVFAHILSRRAGAVTDLQGRFVIKVDAGDTLFFSHVYYHQHSYAMAAHGEDSLVIFLSPKEILLNEVVIGELPSEEQFKKQILATEILPTQREINANQNVDNTRRLFLSGYTPTMNSTDNYKKYIQGPQGVSIFSSDPSKGIFKAIRKIKEYNDPQMFQPGNTKTADTTQLNFRLRRDNLGGG